MFSGTSTHLVIPSTPILVRIHQHLQMPILCSVDTHIAHSLAAMLMGVFEHIKMSIERCIGTSL